MTDVDGSVRGFSIAFYPPGVINTVVFCAALAVSIAAGAWLGLRFYLHRYGAMAEGTVTELSQKSSLLKGFEFSGPARTYIRYLTIEFTAPDGVKRTVKGTDYSNEKDRGSKEIPRVGGKVPVLYSRSDPDNALFYDAPWHYIVPVASLAVGLILTFMATGLCYKDIRAMNSLSLSGWTEEQYRGYLDVIIGCNDAIDRDPNDAASYERRGDAQFAVAQFRDATADYGEALRLAPDRRELLLKRAKAEWLDGRDSAALRDWLKSR